MAKSFENILREMADTTQIITADMIYRLSEINDDDLKLLRAAWGGIPVERRLLLVQRYSEAAETNFDLNFDAVTRLALTDLNDEVREAAVEATWDDETVDMATRLIAMASGDLAESVRAAAVSALGNFILLGELGKFDADVARRAQNIALKLYNDEGEAISVRRRALEALGNSSRDEVNDLINDSYVSDSLEMRASAIFAMGRSFDHKWEPTVLQELGSDEPQMRYEAARAVGELQLHEALPQLAEMIADDDREIMEMAIWALGEIGGDEARRLLEDVIERADEAGDDSLADAVEEALEAASLAGEDLSFS